MCQGCTLLTREPPRLTSPQDCGTIPTTRVDIDFFDPWKLQQAYDTVYAAIQDGWNYGEGIKQLSYFDLDEASAAPRAGW